ncbi:hypothetical protein HEQ63_01955 [Haematospirillum jordaniae]|uniref:peptidyl-prolyl cis-trans isomerase n=1 Tax=Haematospirillum jordaniae TaxID=1549855 RepID=UPI001432DAD4|nr:peptidyl-prolyl cis-trans isomerase [Haematospirillum jordaniae]NKD84952.1 hypothetical protein [Haematospirillum jordaniae]
MLDALRKSTGSLVAKILFAVLILSFGIWGIGDVVNSRANNKPALTVGDIEISGLILKDQLARQMDRLRQIFGPSFDADAARQIGLIESTVASLSASAAQEMLARDLGIVISDTALREVTIQQPAFQNAEGAFDRTRFNQVLAANNLTEQGWLEMARKDLVHARLEDALTSGIVTPLKMAEALYRIREERRDAHVLQISAAAQDVAVRLDDSALHAFYEENKDVFAVPETRDLSVLIMNPTMLEARITVSDEDVTNYYNTNQDLFTTPESRPVTQVIVETEDAAKHILSQVDAGSSLADAAINTGSGKPLDMGIITRNSLPEDIAAAVWSLPENGVSQPVQSAVGWHVFSAGPLVPAQTKRLETVSEDIKAQLKREKAAETFNDVAQRIEDNLASGTSYKEIADTFGINLVAAASIAADGSSPLPADLEENVLKEAFALAQGEESRLIHVDGGAFVVKVNAVHAQTIQPFQDVREKVEALWKKNAQKTAAAAMAEQLAAELTSGKTPNAIINKAPGITVSTISGIGRDGRHVNKTDNPMPPQIVQALFTLPAGTASVVKDDQNAYVLRVDMINPADPDKDSHGVMTMRNNVHSALVNDVTRIVTDTLIDRYGMHVNQDVINNLLP